MEGIRIVNSEELSKRSPYECYWIFRCPSCVMTVNSDGSVITSSALEELQTGTHEITLSVFDFQPDTEKAFVSWVKMFGSRINRICFSHVRTRDQPMVQTMLDAFKDVEMKSLQIEVLPWGDPIQINNAPTGATILFK